MISPLVPYCVLVALEVLTSTLALCNWTYGGRGVRVAGAGFMMLSDADAVATIAVKDLNVAKKFYEETLGFRPFDEQNPGGARYHSGNSTLFVYESRYAGTNQATSATWVVDDAEDVVRVLKAKGVSFEHYDLPGLTRQGDLHVAGSFKGAWFKDPDGNILHVLNA